MDPNLSRVTSKRIHALFSSNSQEDRKNLNFTDKNRSKEMKRLSKSMDVDVPQLREFLKRQKPKLELNSPKAKYIEWILEDSSVANERKAERLSSTKKSKKNKDPDMEEKKSEHVEDVVLNTQSPSKKRKVVRPRRPVSPQQREAADLQEESNQSVINILSGLDFADCENLHPYSKRAIKEVLQLKSMTEIQAKTFSAAASGNDVLGRARTGTGKTLAFLLPAIERIVQSKDFVCGINVGILIISPTRELATQIGDQAEKLLTFYPNNMKVQVMFGGTKMGRDVNFLNKHLPSILVATPGRLLDHMENTKLTGGRQFGYDIMRNTNILVLDETDRLLDMGFRREISKILAFLPRKERRQTLLFSATVPDELKQIMSENMREDFIEVDCINDDSDGSHTNVQVEQSHVILPNMDRYISSVAEIMQLILKDPAVRHKVVVFFPTARMVSFFSDFFNLGLGIDVIELHSKKSQSYRNKASDKFRKAKTGVLFTSDVSARGVDYPDVTNVIQFGLPESREQYIHRLGRTGRAGKAGKGLLVLAPFESGFLSELKGLDVSVDNEINNLFQSPGDNQTINAVDGVVEQVNKGDPALVKSAQQAYQAFLGYYLGQIKRTKLKSKGDVVTTANNISVIMGLNEVPAIFARTVGKMGLKGVKGIVIDKDNKKQNTRRR